MKDDSDTCSVTTYSTFHSTASLKDGNDNFSDFRREGSDAMRLEFCLDIEKLEAVVTLANHGVPCRICRRGIFERATYFLLCADFVDGTLWDIIIPHPSQLKDRRKSINSLIMGRNTSNFPNSCETGAKKPLPKILGWSDSINNAAGVPYLFVDSIKGYDDWKSKDWIKFAIQQEESLRATTSTSSSESSFSCTVPYHELARRSTQETGRTELSKASKSAKSVRFGDDITLEDSGLPAVKEEKLGFLSRIIESVQRGLERIKRILQDAGRKIESRLIATLMKWGY